MQPDEIEFAPELPVAQHGARLRPLSDVHPRNVQWLVPGMIPLRTLTLVAGIGGLGKSTWLFAIAAQVSRGDHLGGQPGDVIICSFEDPAEEVLRPRIEAAGGDLKRVHEIVFDGKALDTLQLPTDILVLDQFAGECSAKMIIFDPIVAAIETDYDTHKDQHVRSVLGGLVEIAEKHGCAPTMVGHLIWRFVCQELTVGFRCCRGSAEGAAGLAGARRLVRLICAGWVPQDRVSS